jgi:acetyl-CoA C-acetyltransferase/acetyl-CoA acyltransferase
MNAEPIVIIAGVRTPFAKLGTSLAGLGAADLARTAILGLLVRTAIDPSQIDEVILGCVAQPADAPNMARVAALRSGIPKQVPAVTVQRNCASGTEAITQACLRIQCGEGSLYLVGGVESMSNIPLLFPRAAGKKFAALVGGKGILPKARAAARLRPRFAGGCREVGTAISGGLNMGETAEIARGSLEREEQDAFALREHSNRRLHPGASRKRSPV